MTPINKPTLLRYFNPSLLNTNLTVDPERLIFQTGITFKFHSGSLNYPLTPV